MRLAGTNIALLVFVALLLAGAAYLFLRPSAPGEIAAATSPPDTAEPQSETVAVLAEPAQPPPPVATEVREVAELEAAVEEQAPVEKELPDLVFSGSVVLVDARGVEHVDLDGKLTLTLWLGSSGTQHPVRVEGGRFEARFEAVDGGYLGVDSGHTKRHPSGIRDASIGVQSPVMDGVAAARLLEPKARHRFGDAGVQLRLREIESVLLHVEDSLTGAALDGVDVLLARDWKRDDYQHPGLGVGASAAPLGELTDTILVENGSSPIALPRSSATQRKGVKTCFIGVPGYAWRRMEIDFNAGGERRVRLSPGGDLSVTLLGDVDQSGAVLRIQAAGDSTPFASTPLRGRDSIGIGDLPPGVLGVSVEIGDWWDEPLVVASTEVEVRVSETAHTELVLSAPRELERAHLAGIVIVPAAWELERFYISVELMETPLDGSDGRHVLHFNSLVRQEADGSGDETYGWDVGEVQIGSYELGHGSFEYSIVIELGPEGARDVVFRIPPPVTLSVLVRDTTTGETAEIDRLLWNCKRPPGITGGGLEVATRASGEDRFRFRVPRGEVDLRPQSEEYTVGYTTITAELDGQEVTLEVERAASALVQLRDGDTPIPWPEAYTVEVAPLVGAVEGGNWVGSRGPRDGGIWFKLTAPGFYRVAIPEVEGYEPHEPVEFEAVAGEKTEVVVQLVRSL